MQRDGRLQRQLERLAIHDRQRAGQAQRHRIGLGIRRQPELGAAPREHLALGLELNVNLEADDDVVIHTVPYDLLSSSVKSVKSCSSSELVASQ